MSYKAIRDYSKFLSRFDLSKLVAGSSKELGLHSQTIQGVTEQYSKSKEQSKKRKLRWRTSSKSLGWIPVTNQNIKIMGDKVIYNGREIRFWKSQELIGRTLCGSSFSEDAKGNWYFNVTCEVPIKEHLHEFEEVGIDLGLTSTAVLSDGEIVENPRTFSTYGEKLANFQRHGKKKQARNLAVKIKNIRRDFFHKRSTEISKKYQNIYVGDVSGKFLQSTHGKSSTDASTGLFRQFLKYKAIKHSGTVVDVSESSSASTVTCSVCFNRTGPSGLSDLGVREWKCRVCGTEHIRDVNAAQNHLRLGRETLRPIQVEGSLDFMSGSMSIKSNFPFKCFLLP